MHMNTHTYIPIHMKIQIDMDIHIHMHIQLHIHTHTNTVILMHTSAEKFRSDPQEVRSQKWLQTDEYFKDLFLVPQPYIY